MSQQLTFRRKANRKHAKKLTFEQINPRWCHIIHSEPATKKVEYTQNHTRVNLTDPKFCVVGEAYGFKGGYFNYISDDFCQGCFNHSLRFAYILEAPAHARKEEVDSFVDHWNTTHV